MGANLTRLKRLVREANERQREKDEEHERYMAMVTGALLAHSPGLRLVEPCDTDPETYARIQETIATSERRTNDAKKWRAKLDDPTHPDHSQYKKWSGGTVREFAEYMNAGLPAFNERCEREKRAVEAAEKHRGITRDKPYEPMPEPLE
ncbi:MAG TPA: hypothetical protein VHN77_02945 [Phycisphaerales bacterium]|nr:hypothetical protein [Phycisphaerales bacterium]